MNALRVAMVTRRYWPLAQSVERLAAELGQALMQQGVIPEIVTARFDARWPTHVNCRGVTVHRLPFPRSPFGWGTMRYMIALSRWLRRNRPDIDAVLVFGMSLDAYAAVGALQATGIPVLVRVDAEDVSEPLKLRSRRTAHIHRRCQGAAALVTGTEALARQCVDRGFSPSQIQWIPHGVPSGMQRTQDTKLAARAALANANEDLRVGMNSPVVTYLGPLVSDMNLETLIEAWQAVAARLPHARLWLLGDGDQRERLFRTIQDSDLTGRVLMPGTFDETDEVLVASDLVVVPASIDQTLDVLRAMAGRVPVLAAHSTENDNLLGAGRRGRLFDAGDAQQLAQCIHTALDDREASQAMAGNAAEFVSQYHKLETMATSYRQLIHCVVRTSKRLVP